MSRTRSALPFRFAIPALVLAVFAVALAACGSDDNSPPLSPTQTPAIAPTEMAAGPTVVPPTCVGDGIGDIERTGERRFSEPPEMVVDTSKSYIVEIQTTKGLIVIEMPTAKAPQTINSFIFLSCTGYYDGLTFHRVESQARGSSLSIIQGGDPRGNGTGGPGYVFDNEISDLTHEAGVISMANAGPDTNGSQFFITFEPAPALDGRYSVFGTVTEGLDVVESIAVGDRMLAVSVREAS